MYCNNNSIPQGTQPKQAIPLIPPSTPRPSSPCGCGCSEIRAELSDNSTHYASWRCTECDRFRGWIPKPPNTTATQTENELIDMLLTSGKLSAWELQFCESLKEYRKRTPKQKEKLAQIAKKRLGFDGQHGQIADTDSGSHLFSEGGEG